MHCPLYVHFFEKKIRCIHLRCSQHTMNKNTVLTCKAGLENCSAGLRQANNTDMFCTFEWYACMFFFFLKNTLMYQSFQIYFLCYLAIVIISRVFCTNKEHHCPSHVIKFKVLSDEIRSLSMVYFSCLGLG